MKNIKIQINTENDAFNPEWESEVARILQKLADDLCSAPQRFNKLLDLNGNVVGFVIYEE